MVLLKFDLGVVRLLSWFFVVFLGLGSVFIGCWKLGFVVLSCGCFWGIIFNMMLLVFLMYFLYICIILLVVIVLYFVMFLDIKFVFWWKVLFEVRVEILFVIFCKLNIVDVLILFFVCVRLLVFIFCCLNLVKVVLMIFFKLFNVDIFVGLVSVSNWNL